MKGNAPLETLKTQPGQSDSYNPSFHPLPGPWAQKQLEQGDSYHRKAGSTSSKSTELQRALAAENQQHEYWENYQGVTPGKAVYVNPRGMSDSLQPKAKYGTEGAGYG
jgi:hypothetical protein